MPHAAKIDSDSFLPGAVIIASAVALFAELAVIRYEASVVPILGVFKNLSLIGCFFGLGIGFSRGNAGRSTLLDFFLRFFLLVLFLTILRLGGVATEIGNPISEQLAMGFATVIGGERLAAYSIIIAIFFLTAYLFIPLGELTGSLLERTRPRLLAYGCNLLGSLLGIGAFSILCWLCLGPITWFAVILCALAPFLVWQRNRGLISIAGLAAAFAMLAYEPNVNVQQLFSPYQNLVLAHSPDTAPTIATNGLYYQKMYDLRPDNQSADAVSGRKYYDLPYRIIPAPHSVLIVGSGSGNDVAAALRGGAKEITGVEIDPLILEIGKRLHPEQPYSSASVHPVVNDARRFFRSSDQKFDLIVYGLLDSHTLLSGFTGGLRLDSYVYTVEAMKEARARLKPGGMIFLSFVLMNEAFAKKMHEMITTAFDGQAPIVVADGYDGGATYIAGRPLTEEERARLGSAPQVGDNIKALQIETSPSTDNWPFLYMPVRTLPTSYLPILGAVLAVAFFILRREPQLRGGQISWTSFLLGAGFMLIETKALTELALEFGAVFSVMTITIGSILFLAFMANLFVSRGGKLPDQAVYAGLILSLAAGFFMTYRHAEISASVRSFTVPLLLTIPMFFSGIAFSRELQRRSNIGPVLGVNLLGAMIGAGLEYFSMYFGFRALYLFAIALYAMAFLTRTRGELTN